MVFVVRKSDFKTLNKVDAWLYNSIELMRCWAADNGYEIISEDITAFGDMVIWVE